MGFRLILHGNKFTLDGLVKETGRRCSSFKVDVDAGFITGDFYFSICCIDGVVLSITTILERLSLLGISSLIVTFFAKICCIVFYVFSISLRVVSLTSLLFAGSDISSIFSLSFSIEWIDSSFSTRFAIG